MPFKPEDYEDSNSPKVTSVEQQKPTTIGPKPGKNVVDTTGEYSENVKAKALSSERHKVAGNAR